MKKFLIPFSAVLLFFTCYLGWRLAASPVHWVMLVMMAFLLFLLPALHWRSKSKEGSPSRKLLQQASYLSMGFLSWLLVLAVVRDLGLVAMVAFAGDAQADDMARASGGSTAFTVALALTGFGMLNAWRGLRVREVSIPIAGLPQELVGLKIAQISDLHVGPTIGRSYVERLVGMVAALEPDLTVLTGDIADGRLSDLRDAAAPLGNLLPKGKVFYVPGNHEYYRDYEAWLQEFKRLGATVLLNCGEALIHNGQQIWVGGVTDPAAAQTKIGEAPNAALAAVGGEAAGLRLLLSHRPGIAAEAEQAGFHLQLSGHTHGGQFFPWTYVAKFFHQYFIGLMKHEGMWIYVSPGSGTWGPPLRMGTTPEVTCIRLQKADS